MNENVSGGRQHSPVLRRLILGAPQSGATMEGLVDVGLRESAPHSSATMTEAHSTYSSYHPAHAADPKERRFSTADRKTIRASGTLNWAGAPG
jgi:hypothetical protein